MKIEGIFKGQVLETLAENLAKSFNSHYSSKSDGTSFLLEIQLSTRTEASNSQDMENYLKHFNELVKNLKKEDSYHLILNFYPVQKEQIALFQEVKQAVEKK